MPFQEIMDGKNIDYDRISWRNLRLLKGKKAACAGTYAAKMGEEDLIWMKKKRLL
jgi:hypothetical protein